MGSRPIRRWWFDTIQAELLEAEQLLQTKQKLLMGRCQHTPLLRIRSVIRKD